MRNGGGGGGFAASIYGAMPESGIQVTSHSSLLSNLWCSVASNKDAPQNVRLCFMRIVNPFLRKGSAPWRRGIGRVSTFVRMNAFRSQPHLYWSTVCAWLSLSPALRAAPSRGEGALRYAKSDFNTRGAFKLWCAAPQPRTHQPEPFTPLSHTLPSRSSLSASRFLPPIRLSGGRVLRQRSGRWTDRFASRGRAAG